MRSNRLLIFVLLSLLFLRPPLAAFAHGSTEVGDYTLVLGFLNEPAYQGEPNGLDLRITHTQTGEGVAGLEGNLRAEIIYGGSTKELQIEPRFGQEGAYTAAFLPTEAGDYTWHIFGTIEDTPVDVSMTSSPDTFSSIEPKSVVSFPGAEPSSADLLESSAAAVRTAQIALLLGGTGVIVGLVGLFIALRSRQALRRAAP